MRDRRRAAAPTTVAPITTRGGVELGQPAPSAPASTDTPSTDPPAVRAAKRWIVVLVGALVLTVGIAVAGTVLFVTQHLAAARSDVRLHRRLERRRRRRRVHADVRRVSRRVAPRGSRPSSIGLRNETTTSQSTSSRSTGTATAPPSTSPSHQGAATEPRPSPLRPRRRGRRLATLRRRSSQELGTAPRERRQPRLVALG